MQKKPKAQALTIKSKTEVEAMILGAKKVDQL